jgi:DNA-directed RNA polymerase
LRESYESKLKRQLALEEEGIQLGIQYYKKQIQETSLADLPPGIALLHRCIEPMTRVIREFKKPRVGGGKLIHTLKFLRMVPDIELAYITAKKVINSISTSEPIQHIAIELATMVRDHIEYNKFKGEQPDFLYAVENNLRTSHIRHRKRVIMRAKRKLGIEDTQWSEEDRLHVGVKLIDLFIESTGLVEKVLSDCNHYGKGKYILQGTEEVRRWVEVHHAKNELLNPLYMPMIIKPIPWETVYGGGFYSNIATLKKKMVKTRNFDMLNTLSEFDMPIIYRVLNAIQDTPWRINKRLYEIMNEAWEHGEGIGDLPSNHEKELPPTPWKNDSEYEHLKAYEPEVVKAWKIEAKKVYEERIRTKSKRFAMYQKLWLAEKFKDEEKIYFVWTIDWRGRLYPVQGFINPQADDTGKALIEFAEGKPLGERGVYWLKIHLANCFGVDKVSFEQRIEWVEKNTAFIIDSVENPLDGLRFWCEAKKPYQFLAAALEYVGYLEEGDSYKSHLPIAMDGSCNGLQNFSAMLLDEVGGRATNLVPCDTPQDVYREVAETVSKLIEQDAQEGNEMALLWRGRVNRAIVKRPVMTVPYGVRQYGMRDQILDILESDDSPIEYVDDKFPLAVYLADKLYDAIGNVVIAARKAMDWLQEVATIASKAECPLYWVTPSGFLVHQEYTKKQTKQIKTFWGGIRVALNLEKDTNKINKNKQKNGISPNFVHSMDASHLSLTVNKCLNEGITAFSMIHDSYGTHAAETDKLAKILREVFIEQYSKDVLEDFRQQIITQLPQKYAEQIPPVPGKGDLNLGDVIQAKYFFA